jgi:radical SAM protein with 4Fe4S-binding SPASM domain
MRVRNLLDSASMRLQKYAVNTPCFGLPYAVQMEITTKCNLRCEICLRSKKEAGAVNSDMPLDLFNSIVTKLRYPTRHVTLVGLGEPLLNPQVYSMIGSAKRKGLKVSLISNFTLLDRDKSLALIDSGLDFLFVSFDSTKKSTFEKIRTGACFEEVIDNVRLFVRTKKEVNAKKPVFFFKSTISKRNLGEIHELVKLAESLGVDGINFGKEIVIDEAGADDSAIFMNIEDFPRSEIIIDLCELNKSFMCHAPMGCHVTYDGKVLPCGLMIEAVPRTQYPQFQLGDLRFDTIGNIWRSTRYRQIRKKIKSGEHLPMCKKCPGWRGG